jgi:peptide subunit release factor 1 (eRF1)
LLLSDLDAIRGVADEIRAGPSHFRAVFACARQRVWKDFVLPISTVHNLLHVGRRFYLAPLVRQLQRIAAYCVVLMETGRARAFLCRGAQIHALSGRLHSRDLSLHADDSRVGWSSHIEGGLEEHERGYFTALSHQIREMLMEHQLDRLIIGCRDDLWGEIGEQVVGELHRNVIGRFHLPSFEMSSTEVANCAAPILMDHQKKHVRAILQEINENPSRGTSGVQDSMNELLNGRVRTLILNDTTGEDTFECTVCRVGTCSSTGKCLLCGGDLDRLPAEEGLIRAALLTGAEILVSDGKDHPAFGAAVLLRY